MKDDTIAVLHVDDDEAFAEMAATYLEREDDRFDVTTAAEASEGIERLVDGDFDCVVSDYDMPGRNGIEFLQSVREEDDELPFILYTGKGSEEVASEAISAGVTDYLQKEVGTDQYTVLANRIANDVEAYRSRRALTERTRRLETLISNLPGMVYRCENEPEWPMSSVGGEVESLTGYTAEELESDEVLWGEGVMHPEDRDRVWRNVQEALSTESHFEVTYRIVTRDGGEKLVWERGRGVYDDGELAALEGFITDVSRRRERELELREKERRYQATFDDPNVVFGLVDVDGTVLDVNQAAMAYVDGAPDEVLGDPFCELSWFDGAETPRAEVEAWVDRAASGEYVEFETDLVGPDGESYLLEGVFRPVTRADGTVESLVVSGREISTRRRNARELEATNALLSTLFDTLPMGVLAEDASRRVMAVNQRLFDLFELDGDPDAVVGSDCARLADETSDLFADPAGFVERIDELVAADEPVRGEEVSLADGRTFARSYRPIELPDGDGHLWVYRDVTDRKDRDRELEVARRRLEAILENTTTPMFMKDADGEYVFVNRGYRSLFDLDDADVVGRTDEDVHPPAVAAEFRENDRAVLERGESLEVEEEFDVGGTRRTFLSEKVPIYDTGERSDPDDPVAVFGLATDVTDLKDRKRELQRERDRLDEFTSIVSHDLRNPLSVALGRVELAAEECDSDHLDVAAASLDRMGALIHDLLTLARDGKPATETEPVALAETARDCWGNVETSRATLTVASTLRFDAHESRLCQLLENLFRNAVKYGGDDVTVTVGALDDGFYVEDDGPGVPPDERRRVFEPGYSTSSGETGFGLSIVEQVAAAHDWDVQVTDGSDGGARFEVTGVESTDPVPGDERPTR